MRAGPGLSRRSFLAGRHSTDPAPLRPPWTDEARLMAACTACGDCISACPQAILSPGHGGLPILSFAERECTLCGRCAEACQEPVFDGRHGRAFFHVAAIDESCFARRGIHCQTCGDACPETAIRFRPRLGGPPEPEVASDSCNGCGACLAACPASAVDLRPLETADG